MSPPPGRLDVEVLGIELAEGRIDAAQAADAVARALRAAGIDDGHAAVEFVDRERIHDLNREHRGRDVPTDVLSFPIDESGDAGGPRELGDVVVCAAEARDLREAVVHGALHLAGMDHERDDGEMLALQREVLDSGAP